MRRGRSSHPPESEEEEGERLTILEERPCRGAPGRAFNVTGGVFRGEWMDEQELAVEEGGDEAMEAWDNQR